MDLIPYIAVVGEKESAENTCNVRSRKEGELGSVAVDTLLEKLTGEVKMRSL